MILGHDKVRILDGPTPLEKLDNLSKDLNVNIYCKRDDLTSLATGGNKLRKLEYFVKEALEQNATMLITEGGAQTNHGRLTAAAAAKFGLKSAIITEDEFPGEISANLLLDGMLGCNVHFVKDIKTARPRIIEQYESEGERVYYIPMGGSNELGVLGYYECAMEITEQAKELGIDNADIICTIGSMGTYLGLLLGLKLENSPLGLIGINVLPYPGSDNYTDNLRQALLEYYARIKAYYNLDLDIDPAEYRIETQYIHGAYNNLVPEVRQQMYYLARREGLIVDPCYTGKTLEGLIDMVKSGRIKPGSNIIFVHTGGYPGIYTKHHRLAMEQELSGYIHIEDF